MAIPRKNITGAFTVAGVTLAAVSVFLLHEPAGFPWHISLKDGLLTTALVCLCMWLLILIMNAYPTRVAAVIHGLVFATFLSALLAYTSHWLLKWWLSGNAAYVLWLSHTIYLRAFIIWMILGWTATLTAKKKQADTLEDKFLKHRDATELLKDAELFKLRQQLQPHFLYNSLNSISALVMIQPDKAQEMIGRLSDFLRSSVKREAEELIPVKDELTFIEAYLSIEAVRFGDRLHVHFTHADTGQARIPPFLMQPLLENAIKFGLYGKTGAVQISVAITLEDPILTIVISNPYDPQATNPRGTGFGLEGIRRRLELLYARTDLLEVQKDENTFTTTLKIPQTHA
ncbi:MAG: histidine kinase [Flavipsychrobacter sp.]|nr:histidine kinase [Flavipsychrobacter sp.]